MAVDRVSCLIRPGEILAVVGESGCGKSLLAMAVLGLLPDAARVTSGSISFEGVDLGSLRSGERRAIRGKRIGTVFQEPMVALNPVMTVGRQVSEVLELHEGLSGRSAREKTIGLFRTVGIPEPERRFSQYPHELSGGMAQRVIIAMAISCGPSLLLADEPTTALDVTVQAGILQTIRLLRDDLGMAVMLITHDLGVVAEIADRVMVMYAGRKVEEAPVDQLFASPRHPYTLGLLGAVRRTATADGGRGARLPEIPGIVPTMTRHATVCAFHPRCPRAALDCRSTRPEPQLHATDHLVACFHPESDSRAAGGAPDV